jgi:hypothetical protein
MRGELCESDYLQDLQEDGRVLLAEAATKTTNWSGEISGSHGGE